jgi:hypothetical protein
VIAAAGFRVTLHGWLQVGAFARLLAAVAFHVRGARFAHCPTMLTLRNWPTLFVNVLQGTIIVLAVADTMASNTSLAGILFTFDDHGQGGSGSL